ncbi:unnamed protein product [Mucor hiemalis]
MSSIASSNSITTTSTTNSNSSSFVDWSLFKLIKSFSPSISQEEKDEVILFNILNDDRKRAIRQHDRNNRAKTIRYVFLFLADSFRL